jgi:hypothetical protein
MGFGSDRPNGYQCSSGFDHLDIPEPPLPPLFGKSPQTQTSVFLSCSVSSRQKTDTVSRRSLKHSARWDHWQNPRSLCY